MPDFALQTEIEGKRLECPVLFTRRKTLQLEVLPDMSVRMIAPHGTKSEVCMRMLQKRKEWLRAQRQYFSQFHPLTKPREYVSGETHLFLGRRLRLKVLTSGNPHVSATRQYLTVCTGNTTSARLVEAAIWQWYREQATDLFQERLLGCMVKLRITKNKGPKSLIVRRYHSRWGSMSPAGVLGLNLDLIRAPIECIDYVIIHELCHLTQPHHGPKFWSHLDQVLPDWRRRKAKLEKLTA